MEPLVSVIVPVFNKAPYLAACLDSILAQTLETFEIVCVDDGSTDGSFEIVLDYARRDQRISVVRLPMNLGPGPARNEGLVRAVGTFVQFTDADDLLPPDALNALWQQAVADHVPIVRGSLSTFRSDAREASIVRGQEMQLNRCKPLEALPALWLPYFHVCYLFSRSLLQHHQLRYPALRCGEDPVLLASALVAAPTLSTIPAVTYAYRSDALRHRTQLSLVDFIQHISMVKGQFVASGHERCWRDGCESFYRDDVITLAAQLTLTDEDRDAVDKFINTLQTGAGG